MDQLFLSTLRVAFIKAQWHSDIVNQSLKGFEEAVRRSAPQANIDVFDVPGAFEIPLKAQKLAQTEKYDAIIGAAFVVDGGIYRHEFVAQAVLHGLMEVQLKTDTPVLSVVLTPHHYRDTAEHRQFFYDHFKVKGKEAAHACVALLCGDEPLELAA